MQCFGLYGESNEKDSWEPRYAVNTRRQAEVARGRSEEVRHEG
jgi:hypothetical protein